MPKENKFTPILQENKVIEIKYAAPCFGRMSEDERKLAAHSVILKISAITGWTIPASDQILDILVDQFEKKLNESYRNVNAEEIEYAFRNRGIETKDWGKALNLTLIDEIMVPYLETRFELSRLEESRNKPLMIENKTKVSDDEINEWLQDWIKKDRYDLELLPLPFYDHLVRTEKITLSAKEKWEYTEKATTAIKVTMQQDMDICKTNNAYIAFRNFERMEKEGFEGELKGRILNRAKRLIIRDYISSVKNV